MLDKVLVVLKSLNFRLKLGVVVLAKDVMVLQVRTFWGKL